MNLLLGSTKFFGYKKGVKRAIYGNLVKFNNDIIADNLLENDINFENLYDSIFDIVKSFNDFDNVDKVFYNVCEKLTYLNNVTFGSKKIISLFDNDEEFVSNDTVVETNKLVDLLTEQSKNSLIEFSNINLNDNFFFLEDSIIDQLGVEEPELIKDNGFDLGLNGINEYNFFDFINVCFRLQFECIDNRFVYNLYNR